MKVKIVDLTRHMKYDILSPEVMGTIVTKVIEGISSQESGVPITDNGVVQNVEPQVEEPVMQGMPAPEYDATEFVPVQPSTPDYVAPNPNEVEPLQNGKYLIIIYNDDCPKKVCIDASVSINNGEYTIEDYKRCIACEICNSLYMREMIPREEPYDTGV